MYFKFLNILSSNTSLLPSGYTQLDFLTSQGDVNSCPYIDTEIQTGTDVVIEAEMRCNDLVSFVGGCGAIYSNNLGWCQCGVRAGVGLASAFTTNSWTGASIPIDLGWHTFYTSNGLQKVDSVITTNTAVMPSVLPIYLFRYNTEYTQSGSVDCSLRRAKIYKGGRIVRDYIPCSTIAGGVLQLGMYDIVNREFYTSRVGSFIAP